MHASLQIAGVGPAQAAGPLPEGQRLVEPGQKAPNRAALGKWGAWVNSFARKEYGRSLFIACSADLADSTNISGFAKDFEDVPGWGWYEREENPRGTLLPQEITEFTNAGIMAGIATARVSQ